MIKKTINSLTEANEEIIQNHINEKIKTLEEISRIHTNAPEQKEAIDKIRNHLRCIYRANKNLINENQLSTLIKLKKQENENLEIDVNDVKFENNNYYIIEGHVEQIKVTPRGVQIKNHDHFRKDYANRLWIKHKITIKKIIQLCNEAISDPLPTADEITSDINNITKAKIQSRHNARMRANKLNITQLSESPTKARETHCYDCKSNLNSGIQLECTRCKWIVCMCGACGCTWVSNTI